jgi:hypothetical protein
MLWQFNARLDKRFWLTEQVLVSNVYRETMLIPQKLVIFSVQCSCHDIAEEYGVSASLFRI